MAFIEINLTCFSHKLSLYVDYPLKIIVSFAIDSSSDCADAYDINRLSSFVLDLNRHPTLRV
jgi:hypothetical protein